AGGQRQADRGRRRGGHPQHRHVPEHRGRGVSAAARDAELPGAAGPAGREREPDRRRPARLQPVGADVQHLHPQVSHGDHRADERRAAQGALHGPRQRRPDAHRGLRRRQV
ncbi:MAG: LemA family protein, partial [uncultured Gemmatimonadetes bacterium]